MHRRSTALFYILFLVSGGQFGFVWAYLMNKDLAQIDPSHIRNLRLYGAVFLVGYVVYLGVVLYWMTHLPRMYEAGAGVLSIMFALGFSLFVGWVYALFRVARWLRNHSVPVLSDAALFLLLFAYGAALPLLQSKLNSYAPNGT